jgi:hypothetical protein
MIRKVDTGFRKRSSANQKKSGMTIYNRHPALMRAIARVLGLSRNVCPSVARQSAISAACTCCGAARMLAGFGDHRGKFGKIDRPCVFFRYSLISR